MKVELLGYFGNDLMAANVARVSYGKNKDVFDEKDAKLLKYLVDHKHTSPFRHAHLQFRVQCSIVVERQLFKHQVGWCLSGDSEITFIKKSGQLKKIKLIDLFHQWNNGRRHQNTEKDKEYSRKRIKGMRLRVLNESSGEFVIGHIKDIIESGEKEIYEITTVSGKKLKCSQDHRLYTNKGWKTISNGIIVGDFIGVNGLKFAGTGEYQNKTNLQEDKKNKLSVSEMAEKYQCSYHTIRKWLKIHNLSFNQKDFLFKKGCKTWNKGIYGYKLNITEEGKLAHKNTKRKYGKDNHFWRGGITTERAKIGRWTRLVAKQIHGKYNFCCQKCGINKKLEVHHIIPVVVDPTLAYNIDNLISVCEDCHDFIHKTAQNEENFAKYVFADNFSIFKKELKFGKNTYNRKSNKLKVHFEQIRSIKKIGTEQTFDIEVDGEHHNFVANNFVVHNSANSISGRYVDFSDSYDLPQQLRFQSKNSKQGSSEDLPADLNEPLLADMQKVVDLAKETYAKLCANGVAKEQARMILPLCLETTFIWTGSMQAFIHLCELRIKPDAQRETREVAAEMLKLVKEIPGNPFKYTIEAFNL